MKTDKPVTEYKKMHAKMVELKLKDLTTLVDVMSDIKMQPQTSFSEQYFSQVIKILSNVNS